MECPICQKELIINQELSRGMGNQLFQDCPFCGLRALISGEVMTQCWPPTNGNGQEGGNKCRHLAHTRTLTNA